ncbi:MAG: PSD1 and planctomycete cytochrome C domain-containing protein [Lentisphaeraceae bacterium]|nr:PSD1 and planctomycete cytochrome C domain-containing protein [Lentisphaeraceae bacterium]
MKSFIIIALLLLSNFLQANEGIIFFEKEIRPALEKYCFRCHSDKEKKIKGNLVLDSKVGVLQGGDSGPAVVPGNLHKSVLWQSITYANNMEMPPKKKLPDTVIASFKKWIEMGAPDPRKKAIISVKSKVTQEDIVKGKEFWSFKPPVFKKPSSTHPDWSKSVIDDYIYSSLKKKNIKPSPDAASANILRRLSFDLLGLPPSPSQIKSFEKMYAKGADKAIESVVNYFLKSPQFGERWGRHWLDIARYAESNGKVPNATYPEAWRYRDYVISSFNQDKPYSQFITEQLAGDLLKTASDKKWAENLVATGFLVLGPKNLSGEDQRQFKADLIDEQIDAVTRSLMGLSVACARCHDHKFDPIPQSDYYALAGIFQSTKSYYGTSESLQNKNRSALIKLPIKDAGRSSRVSRAEIQKQQQVLTDLEEERRILTSNHLAKQNPTDDERKYFRRKTVYLKREIFNAQEVINSVDSNGNAIAFCMGVQPTAPVNSLLLEKGQVNKPAQEVPRGYVQVVGGTKSRINPKDNGRKKLAEWITSKGNPLTARVLVNNVWLKIFGNGIVLTPEDFGSTGQRPTHPELLDYLALDFMRNNWSIKKLIKKIALSRAYRVSSEFNSEAFKQDPDNKLLWRYSPKRLDAEVLRDSILAVSGELDLTPPQGSIIADKGHTIIEEQFKLRYEESTHDKIVKYRSVYLPIVRDQLPGFLKAFDFTDSMKSQPQRDKNKTATQALFMLNDNFVIVHSDLMAKRIIKKYSSINDQIKMVFQLCFSRLPSRIELDGGKKLFQSVRYSKDLKDKQSDTKTFVALSAICQALFLSTEFRYQY